MNLIRYQLTRPFSYLQIKHESKWIYDWAIPVVLTLMSTGYCYLFMSYENVQNLIDKLSGFIGSLPGFFIAALAAIATFDRPEIDQKMSGVPPKLKVLTQGNILTLELTRRRFLTVLFSYLTAVSILTVIFSYIGLNSKVSDASIMSFLNISFVSLFFFLLWQMVIATMFGLYFLGEQLHNTD